MDVYYWDRRIYTSALFQMVLLVICYLGMTVVVISDPLTTFSVVFVQVVLLLSTVWLFVEFVLWTISNTRRVIRLSKRGI